MIRPTVHANPSRKSNRRNSHTPDFFFVVWTENILKTESFENDDVMIITWYPCPIFLNTNPKWPVMVAAPYEVTLCVRHAILLGRKIAWRAQRGYHGCTFKFLRHCLKKNIWRVFFWSNVNWALACFSSQSVGMIEKVGERRAGKSALLFFPVSTDR